MVKHRRATVFTAANPAILAGGFVGESKFDILQGLAGASEWVARASLIGAELDAGAKVEAATRFMADCDLTYPVVLTPNHGQGGSGVVVVRSARMLEDCLRRSSVDTIVQEYVGGAEFGVFYYRRPSERRGRIFSITEKKFPAMFLDGGWVLTPEVEARFDAIAQTFDGFYFGRFDVRVDGGINAFRAGHGFKIIELNGVTSEATHIYHPGTPLIAAYRVLMEQWRIAFEIGAENRRRGVVVTPMRGLVKLWREYARISRWHLDPMRSSAG